MVRGVKVEERARIAPLILPFQRFMAVEASGGIVLLACTAIALIWANSPWAENYHDLWHTYLTVTLGEWQIKLSLAHWVNDALMAIFFFVVGLEIKRELLVGELASLRRAALPIVAAVGGMLVPAAVYAAFNAGGEGAAGWGVPVATDIAFALGVMALLGRRVPLGLKVFLTALAIVDDIGAVLVIAVFYTAEVSGQALMAAGFFFVGMIVLNVLGVRRPIVYLVAGILLWMAVFASGIHATIAGVLAAFAIPAKVRLREESFSRKARSVLEDFEHADEQGGPIVTNARRQAAIHSLEKACEHVQPPLLRLEHMLVPWVAFLIMPIFALANAGVQLGGDAIDAVTGRTALGVALGLLLGKLAGVTAFTWLAVKTGVATLPAGVTWRHILGAALLAGVGFTMSLFIANLAFETEELLTQAKIGILCGSLIAGISGFIVLRIGK
jgi:NhaA family Na+:H+ antiporter